MAEKCYFSDNCMFCAVFGEVGLGGLSMYFLRVGFVILLAAFAIGAVDGKEGISRTHFGLLQSTFR